MGRNLSDHSESPIRYLGGSPRRNPSRRERTPVRLKSSHRDTSPTRDKEKRSSRAKSPKHAQSRSPVSRSPSPRTRRLMRSRDEREGEKVTYKENETNNGRRSDKGALNDKLRSPPRSPSPRLKRLMRAPNERGAEKFTESENERNRDRGNDRETHRERSHSPVSRSPSPRTKRLRRAQAEKETAKVTEREHEKNHGKASDKGSHRDRGLDRETGSERKEKRGFDRDIEVERKERRLGRDEVSRKSTTTRHEQSSSPLDQPHKSRHTSCSPQLADGARARHEVTNLRGSEHRNDDKDSVAKMKAAEEALETKEKEKPSFELSGKLAAETNRFRGVTLLFNEPPEARKPNIRWRLYVFKAGEVLKEPLYIHRQSCYLFGRERRVADIPTDHPSCSKQHAVVQFRQVEKENADGTSSNQIKPYLMDLGSTNKTYLNENPIEPQRYYELFEKDTIKFAGSMYYCMRTQFSEVKATPLCSSLLVKDTGSSFSEQFTLYL